MQPLVLLMISQLVDAQVKRQLEHGAPAQPPGIGPGVTFGGKIGGGGGGVPGPGSTPPIGGSVRRSPRDPPFGGLTGPSPEQRLYRRHSVPSGSTLSIGMLKTYS